MSKVDTATPTAGTPATTRRVSAVVVNWNTERLLEPCLRSLFDAVDDDVAVDVVVVDNGSTDGSLALLRRDWPAVAVIENADNRGFTRATNQGIEATTGENVLLINTDAELTPGCLRTMLDRLDGDARAAVVGPRLVYGNGEWQRWTAGRAPSLASLASFLLFADRLGRRIPALAGLYLGTDTAIAFCPDWVSSACMLVRREAFDEVGLLDERIFVYMDDVELCQRVRDAGWRVWYEPGAVAVHLMGQSSARPTRAPSKEALLALNRYFAQGHGRAQVLALRAVEAVGFGLRAGLYAVRTGGDSRTRARGHWASAKISVGSGR